MMPIEISYEFGDKGITVPYPPIKDGVRNNRGFVDLRGRPQAAETIAEARGSPALRSILMRLAAPESSVATLGCDLGQHEDSGLPSNGRHVAGGYVQVAALDSPNVTPEMCERYTEAVVSYLTKTHWWRVAPTFCWVHSYLSGDLEKVPSVWFWFWCLAQTPKNASASRERFLAALQRGLVCREAVGTLKN